MASVKGIRGGLVWPKSGNVEKVLVLKVFLEGSREPGGFMKFPAVRAPPHSDNVERFPTNRVIASGTSWGSVFGHFCVFLIIC